MIFSIIWNLLFFIIAISLLVSVHECGHFFMARLFNVKVERFSIGFGKILWKRISKHGTEFAISLIPLGGYVKMLDERNGTINQKEKHLSYNSKPFLAKFLIVFAGPLTNLLLGIILYSIVFSLGINTLKPIIDNIDKNSIVDKHNIQPNSQILKIAGKDIQSWDDAILLLVDNQNTEKVELITKDLQTQQENSTNLDLTNWFVSEKTDPLKSLGINIKLPTYTNIIIDVGKDSPAAKSGIMKGDKILSINNKQVNWLDFVAEIKASKNKLVNIAIERQNHKLNFNVLVEEKNQAGFIGVASETSAESNNLYTTINYGLYDSITQSTVKVYNLSLLILKTIYKLIIGEFSLSNLSGPVSIAQGAGNAASIGFVYYLVFLALISVNLGVINILPLPVLDGGHILFLIIESITKKPVNKKIQELFYIFGMFMLLFLTFLSIFYDIVGR